jgi:hypothetical protein
MRRVSTFKAEHFEDRLLRSKHRTTANGTNLDGWHGNRDEEIFAIVRSGTMVSDGT